MTKQGQLLDKAKKIPTENDLKTRYVVTDEQLAELRDKYKIPGDLAITANYDAIRRMTGELKKLRAKVEDRRKELKAESLEYGRRVDAVAKYFREQLEEIERPLLEARETFEKSEAEKAKAEEEARLAAQRKREQEQRDAEDARLREERRQLEAQREQLAAQQRQLEEQQRQIREAQEAQARREREAQEQEQRRLQAIADEEARKKREAQEAEDRKLRAEQEQREREEREAQEAREAQAREARRLAARPDVEKLQDWSGKIREAMRSPCPLTQAESRASARRAAAAIEAALKTLERDLNAI